MRLKKLRVTFFSFVPLLLEITTISMLLLILLLASSSQGLPAAAPTSTSSSYSPWSSSSSSSSSSSEPSTASASSTPTTTISSRMLMSTTATYHDLDDNSHASSKPEQSEVNGKPSSAISPYPTEAGKSTYQNSQFPTQYTAAASQSTGASDHEFYRPHNQNDSSDHVDVGEHDGTLSHDYQSDQYHHFHEQHDGPNNPGRDNCVLPESWKGRWFQSGVSPPILIDSKSMGEKGTCYERSGDKFLFVASEKNQDCFRCIVINERHKNVLQYKESSYCEEKNSLENLCSQIPGDAQLYSLFRIDAQPEDCPFKGAPFTFTYNRGHGECKNPVSYVDTCTEPSRLLLRYQACPDVQKTESTAEELQCLAQWKEGSHHYLVGKLTRERTIPSNEESYRCFIYEKTKSGHGGYTVAMSGDATCSGIASSTEGARTLTFSKVDKGEGKCAFPAWVASHHWHTLDGKMSAKMMHHKNSTMHITEDNRRNSSSGHYSLLSGSSMMGLTGLPLLGASGGAGAAGLSLGGIGAVGVAAGTNAGTSGGLYATSSSSSLFTGGTRIVCQNRVDIVEGRHVAIVAKHTQGCKTEDICMRFYQRTKHVMEIQMQEMSEDIDCLGKNSALGPTYVTLVSSGENSRYSSGASGESCPNLGRYLATGVSNDDRVVRDACGPMGQGGFQTLIIGCEDRATMHFHSANCPSHNPISSYECLSSWEDGGIGFLVAYPLSRSSTSARGRFCFAYSETDEGLQVFSSSQSCPRNVSPGKVEGVWAFNLTVDGSCAQAITGASSAIQSSNLILALSILPVISILLQLVDPFFFINSMKAGVRTKSSVADKTLSSITKLTAKSTSSIPSRLVCR